MRAILLALLVLFSSPAWAHERAGVRLDPAGLIRPSALEAALAALDAYPQARRDLVVVVDFALPSTTERFYVVDLATGAVSAYRTAHGKGSDPDHDGMAQTFSNRANSHASTLGAYLALKPYSGQHGASLALRGLEPGNSNAEARAIVLHSAPYMTQRFIQAHGRPGRSWGCFVVAPHEIEPLIGRLKGGALLVAVK